MKKREADLHFLEQFIPEGTYEQVAHFFKTHIIHLTITRERKSVLGDYRHPTRDEAQHRISINANLNRFSFLITLLHELAHMITFLRYQRNAEPHGKEWKAEFRQILIPFLGKHFFPADVEKALIDYLHNPSASTCTDPHLYKALYRYDERQPGNKLVDDFKENELFEYDGQIFQKISKVRTRTKCKNIKNGKMYFFSGIAEVKEYHVAK